MNDRYREAVRWFTSASRATTVLAATFVALVASSALAGQASALDVSVLDSPYAAAGDGTTNDRVAIQNAIDDVSGGGGGTVTLPGVRTYLSGDVELKSNVTLDLAAGAVLKQSQNQGDYAHTPALGRQRAGSSVQFDSNSEHNWPLVYAGSGANNVGVVGGGTIQISWTGNDATSILINAIGFYDVSNFEIAGVTIDGADGYNIAVRSSDHGTIHDVTTTNPATFNSDGINLYNDQNVRVDDNDLTTDDDGIWVGAIYDDPRDGSWWVSNPEQSRDIEIDHNTVNSIQESQVSDSSAHGFLFINWTAAAPDPRQVEVLRINVHDNDITGPIPVGALVNDVYHGNAGPKTPVKQVRFANNTFTKTRTTLVNEIQNLLVTDLSADGLVDSQVKSAPNLLNDDFDGGGDNTPSGVFGDNYWSTEGVSGADDSSVGQPGGYYGFISGFDQGYSGIYQGIYLTPGTYTFSASVQSNAPIRMFAYDPLAAQTIASKQVDTSYNWSSETLTVSVGSAGTYRFGIDDSGVGTSGSDFGRIDSAFVG